MQSTGYQFQTQVYRFAPTTGSTVTIPDSPSDVTIIISPATDLASLTLAWSATPFDGQCVRVLCTKNITTLNHTGGSLNRSVNSMTASGDMNFVWDAGGSTWMSDGVTNAMFTSLVFTATVSGGAGNAVFYPTSDLTSTGTALFSSIQNVNPRFDSGDPNFGNAKPVISNVNKTVTINCKYQTFTGVVVLGISVLGASVVGNAPNGTVLTVVVTGILA